MRHKTTEILNTFEQSGDWQHRDFKDIDIEMPAQIQSVFNVSKH